LRKEREEPLLIIGEARRSRAGGLKLSSDAIAGANERKASATAGIATRPYFI
jgi:hypothetical protein